MALGNTNFGNDAGTGTVGADGFLGPLTGAVTASTLTNSTSAGLTAHAGGTQAAGLLLTSTVNEVTTVGSANDSVLLPVPTAVGQICIVINAAATNSMQVFGSGTDTINGVATATGVAQAAGKTALYVAATIGTAAHWYRNLSA